MMNSLQLTSTDLVADASPGPLTARINSELSLPLLTSIWCTYQASLLLQSGAVKSGRFLLRCRDTSLADWPLESARHCLLPLTSIQSTYQDTSLMQSVLPNLYDISRVDCVS